MRQWILTAALALALMPAQCWAAGDGFVPLIGIPGVTDQANNTQAFFDAIYGFAIVAAAFLAVVKIMLAGVKYMTTDIADSKAGAKKDIQGALLGLMIVLGAVLILETINPNLTNFALFKDVPTPIRIPVVVYSPPLTTDESGAINLEGLSTEERARVREQLECAVGEKKVVANNQIRCEPNADVNHGTNFNTAERFRKYAERFEDQGTEELYNQYVSPYEPTDIENAAIAASIASVGGDDYLFVIKNLDGDSVMTNAAVVRQQQEILCEKAAGELVDDNEGDFSVCVVIQE